MRTVSDVRKFLAGRVDRLEEALGQEPIESYVGKSYEECLLTPNEWARLCEARELMRVIVELCRHIEIDRERRGNFLAFTQVGDEVLIHGRSVAAEVLEISRWRGMYAHRLRVRYSGPDGRVIRWFDAEEVYAPKHPTANQT